MPLSNYSKSKHYIQKKLTEKVSISDLNFNTGIMFSHESEFRRSNFFTKTIVEFLAEYQKVKKIKLDVGNISIKRDIGYAEEYVEAIYLLMKKNNKEEYIISSNSLRELSEFIDICLNILEIDYFKEENGEDIKYIDKKNNFNFISSTTSEYRKYDLKGVKGDNSKIINELGWVQTYDLEKISRRMIEYEIKK